MAQIYAIACLANGMRYVGCTKLGEKALKKRFREHRCLLRKGRHSEPRFQEDWLKYGESIFAIMTMEELAESVDIAGKRAAEMKWMNYYHAQRRLYNTNMNSFSPKPEHIARRIEAARIANTGRVHTAEERRKRSENNKGKHTGHGDKISATKKALGQRPGREAIERSVLNRQIRAAEKRANQKPDDVC